MISTVSLSYCKKLVSIAQTCFILPAEWNSKLHIFIDARSWAHTLVTSVISVFLICCEVYTLFTYSPETAFDIITMLFINFGGGATFGVLVWLTWKWPLILTLTNGSVRLNEAHGKPIIGMQEGNKRHI